MNRQHRRRRALFKTGAKALARHVSLPEEMYACPICCRAFTWEQLEAKALTLEHVPPKAQAPGAQEIALTCEPCNTAGGHALDAAALKADQLWALAHAMFRHQGHAAGDGYVTVDEHRIGVRYEMRDRVLTVTPRGVNSPAAAAAEYKFWRTGSWATPGERFRFTPHIRYDGWLGRVGSLRTAYLAAFAKYGYQYAMHPRLEPVRRQLQNPGEKRLIGFWYDLDYDDHLGPGIGGFYEPVPCLVVRTNRRGVILPWVEGPGWEYPFPAPAARGGTEPHWMQLTDGAPVTWPTWLEMRLDFADDPMLPFELTRTDDASAPDRDDQHGAA